MQPVSTAIAIDQLQAGEPLPFNLLDTAGVTLLPAGTVLQQSLIDSWVARGFNRVRTGPVTENPAEPEPQAITPRWLQPYDPHVVALLDSCFQSTADELDRFVTQLATQSAASVAPLEPLIQTYLNQLDSDNAVVLANLATPQAWQMHSINHWLAARSVRQGMLAATIAKALHMPPEMCHLAALAGLLHDISLFEDAETNACEYVYSEEDTLASHPLWIQHAQRSAEMLEGLEGLPDVIRLIVAQVHEQVDGQGYPYGIPGRRMHPVSRILNLVDAYLTLTEPLDDHTGIVPSDAQAYLIYHTNRGVFDRECMKAMVLAMSVYPIGSRVELHDRSQALVMRSTGTHPASPIVALDTAPQQLVDLRDSNRKVARPLPDARFPSRRRLSTSALRHILWKPLFTLHNSQPSPVTAGCD
jgi:HD-GYP domain-containing protein (c-di-GMP phosphodiesterase class II)